MLKEQLRKARKAAGITQKDVACHLGVTESTYCGYETGKRQPDALKIRKIAAFLGVSGDYLLETGMESDNAGSPGKHTDCIVCDEPDEIRLIYCFRSLNESGRFAALSAMEGLASSPALIQESRK